MSKQMNKMKKLSPADLLKKLKASRPLMCSPVAYVVDLLEVYSQGTITINELCDQYSLETRKAQFVFSHMSMHDIEENKRVFVKEFTFGNRLTQLLGQQKKISELSAFDDALWECVESYL